MELTVLIPCFNEKPTILKAIAAAKNLNIDKEIIVVDNCSTDGSREILQSLNDDSIMVVLQPKNYGYGQSIKTGLALAKREFIYVQFADMEYDIECAYRMLAAAKQEKLDFVLGSRLYGRTRSLYSLLKEKFSYLGTLLTTYLINIMYGNKFSDIIGTRLYRKAAFKDIHVKSSTLVFDFEIVAKACKAGLKIKELPVSYKPRTYKEGKKIRPIHLFSAIFTLFRVKIFDKN